MLDGPGLFIDNAAGATIKGGDAIFVRSGRISLNSGASVLQLRAKRSPAILRPGASRRRCG